LIPNPEETTTMRNHQLERLHLMDLGDAERTLPRARVAGHPSAWARAPRIERIGAGRSDPQLALRILAEPALIDAAFRANPPGWGDFDPAVLDILMGRR
jgi:hypothetical protein